MRWRISQLAVLIGACWLAALPELEAAAAKPRARRVNDYDPAATTVEMFAAMRDDKISVRLVAKDSTEAKLRITNHTAAPLNVRIPESFAAVHVLAQLGGPGGGIFGGPMGQGRGAMLGGSQSLGMGPNMQNGAANQNPGGNPGNIFCIPPERVGEMPVKAVCLDYGKPDPRSALTYDVRPFDQVTSVSGVAELCAMMAAGKIPRRVAQAAAWHLNNHMTWDEVAKIKINPILADPYSYFDPAEIRAGKQAAEAAQRAAAEKQTKTISPGELGTPKLGPRPVESAITR
ncbi:MAG: hypothetical protein JSS27_12105 [Planctomycetes bacterium]|nr:hypothetical protein [Planctomycetota bacterium]